MNSMKFCCLVLAACGVFLAGIGNAQDPEEIEPGVDTSAPRDESPVNESPRAPQSQRTLDAIELESTQITGNQELPQVLYIVPWKASDLGDLVGRPVNTLLDEVLAPADREVFIRQIEYYEDLQASDPSP